MDFDDIVVGETYIDNYTGDRFKVTSKGYYVKKLTGVYLDHNVDADWIDPADLAREN